MYSNCMQTISIVKLTIPNKIMTVASTLGHGEATSCGYENIQAALAEVSEPDTGQKPILVIYRRYLKK